MTQNVSNCAFKNRTTPNTRQQKKLQNNKKIQDNAKFVQHSPMKTLFENNIGNTDNQSTERFNGEERTKMKSSISQENKETIF